jgi:hypothetical protein
MSDVELPRYEIKADDVTVWEAKRPPTQDQIDRTAVYANGRGWNGVTLDLFCDGVWRGFLKVSPEVTMVS